MKKITIFLMSLIFVLFSIGAWAATIDIKFNNVTNWRNVAGFKAGEYNISSYTYDYSSFCLDFEQKAPLPGYFHTYEIVENPTTAQGEIMWMYDKYRNIENPFPETSATYQAAIWSTVDPTLNFINDDDVNNALYVGLLQADKELYDGYTILHSDEYQDFVIPNQVPIPGAVWLLGAGLISLIGLRRSRK